MADDEFYLLPPSSFLGEREWRWEPEPEPERTWSDWHKMWMDGEMSTATLRLVAVTLCKDDPAAQMWHLTSMSMEIIRPSALVVISCV